MAVLVSLGLVARRPRAVVRVGAAVMTGTLVALLTLVAAVQGALDDPLAPGSAGASPASAEALRDIPAARLALYQDAATTRSIDWAILAAVGKVECDHGRSRAAGCNPPGTVNRAGARGPMQFLATTWRSTADGPRVLDVAGPPVPEGDEGSGYATDGDADGIADPWQAADAIHAAARMLARNGAPTDYEAALHAYNPSDRYVTNILDYAERYRARDATPRAFAGSSGDVPLTEVACPAGGTTQVHAQLGPAVTGLYAAASAAGHQLCGGGFRGSERQVELRRQNCGTSHYAVYEMPASQCSPPTARPGTSNHERGLAIDLTCGGALIRSRSDPCFIWLDEHAEAFGLLNLPSEPWHWSVNAK